MDKETARSLVFEGDRAFAEHDFARALARYSTAYRLVHVPSVGIEVARAQVALGQLKAAYRSATEVVALPQRPPEAPVIARARLDAAQLTRELPERIPSLRLEVTPPLTACRIQIDGVELAPGTSPRALRLDPGRHQLQVRAPGYRSWAQELALAERERKVLTVELQAEPPATVAAPAQLPASDGAAPVQEDGARDEPVSSGSDAWTARSTGYVLLGVASLGVAAGSVSGLIAFGQKPSCPQDRCPPNQKDELAASKRAGHIANVSFGVGLALGAVGTFLLLRSPAAATTSSLATPRLDVEATARGFALHTSGSF